MSLKEELQNLITEERNKLEIRDQGMQSYKSAQESRFAIMKRLLTELANAVPPEYIQKTLLDDSAIISVGWNRPEDGTFETKIRWNIEPNRQFKVDYETKQSWLESAPGFDIQETSFLCYEMFEQKRSFPNEESLVEYIAKQVAEQIAGVEHVRNKVKSSGATN